MNVSVYRRSLGAEPAGLMDRRVPAPGAVDASPADTRERLPVRARPFEDLASLEAALVDTPLRDWRRLSETAPHASLFQSPGWCMPWYRAYQDDYTPFVVMVTAGERLAGVVPLAVKRDDGTLVFASDSMADYRDIVAEPDRRKDVLREFVRIFRQRGFPDPLQVGWLDPESDTAALLEDICREEGLPYLARHQPCYRWFPPPPAKPSAHKFLNWYKRQGAVTFEVVDSVEAWRNFRDDYYRHHSLRQIQAGRPRAFDDPRRAAFYEELFNSHEVNAHVTAFRLDGRLLAGHFGYVWRDVLLLGPPAISLEDEQRSPAVILFSWIIQNAERLGLRGFDLTIGDSDFKKRLGNQCVQLTAVDIYRSRIGFTQQRMRTAALNGLKSVVTKTTGPDGWERRIKPTVELLAHKRARLREEGLAGGLSALLSTLRSTVWERRTGHVYAITRDQLRPVTPHLSAGQTVAYHENRLEDLLRWDGESASIRSDIAVCAQSYARCRSAGRTLHTVVVDDRLAGWGYSYLPDRPAQLTETPGAVLEFPAGSVSLYDFHVVPEFRGRRIYQSLLTHILRQRFAEGARTAWITVLASNRPSLAAIERVGFQLTAANSYRRLFGYERLAPLPIPRAADTRTADEYEGYLEEEWLLFAKDDARQRLALEAVEGQTVRDVLDVGCGGGQDLIPFAARGARCVGIDIAAESGRFASRLFRTHYKGLPVHFATSGAEHLPFRDASFDVVLCRVALPYTDNRQALTEMARVLRPGGVLLLKTHHPKYYVHKALDGVRRRSALFSIHALRVLMTGAIYHVSGSQPGGGILLRETFQTEWLLKRELRPIGLALEKELADSNPLTRSYRVTKRAA
jgi:CelD/BcsL family acetyltransferase involved in cellulose biosynthesis/SAM-dependent methyltransferase/ribosomal protein S18 acetylase RimI-like enzyme